MNEKEKYIKNIEILEELDSTLKELVSKELEKIGELFYGKNYIPIPLEFTKIRSDDKQWEFSLSFEKKTLFTTKHVYLEDVQKEKEIYKNEKEIFFFRKNISLTLQTMLMYRPILDFLKNKITSLPDFFDLDFDEQINLKEPQIIDADVFNERIVRGIDIDNLQETIEKLIVFLENDFPNIEMKFYTNKLLKSAETTSSTPGF